MDVDQAKSWTTSEVIEAWHGLFAGNALSQRFLSGQALCEAELRAVAEKAEVWRANLMSVSWFMRCLNEYIARKANTEDNCTGRFWEGRFKCQALLDESALIACMAYVDLNPVRADIADTPETSMHTAIQSRIHAIQNIQPDQPGKLMPFVGNARKEMPKGLAFQLTDYLELVDWTGRCIRDDKRGSISSEQPPILKILQIEQDAWLSLTQGFEGLFTSLVGKERSVQHVCEQQGKRWTHGINACRRHFPS